MNKLYGSLVDFLVVVGSNQETGLVLKNNDSEEEGSVTNMEDSMIETFILSVLSADVAFYPNSQVKFNLNYATRMSKSKNDFAEIPENYDLNAKRKSITRRQTMKPIETPIQADILQNLPQFCFPEGAMIKKTFEEPTVHSFVLTDIEGKKNFAMVLNFYREFYCCKNERDEYDDDSSQMSDFQLIDINNEDETEAHKNYFFVYIPTSIVLISKFSYFSVLKECVSSIYNDIGDDPSSFGQIIENYGLNLTHFPVAPKSIKRFSLYLEFSLPNKDILITNLDEYGFEVFDISLSLIFQRLSIDTILRVILIILIESKIVFTSRHLGLLTPSIQCFLKLIQPFKWSLPFVPLLPTSQIEFIEAPHPFIMGCTFNPDIQLDQRSGLFIIDLDTNVVRYPESFEAVEFPENDSAILRDDLSKVDFDVIQTVKFTTASKMDLKSLEYFERSLTQELNSKISEIFVDFFVRVYGDLYPYFRQQTKTFNKKLYLESINEAHLPIYTQLTQTAMFDIFLNELVKNTAENQPNIYIDRLNKLMNNGSMLSRRESLQPIVVNSPNGGLLLNGAAGLGDLSQLLNQRQPSLFSTSLNKPINKILKLPNILDSSNGAHDIIAFLVRELESANLLSYKDSLLYLKGLFNLHLNHTAEAFKDFYSIESNTIFPKQLIQDEIYPVLTHVQKICIETQDYYKTAPEYRKIYQEPSNAKILTSLNSVDLITSEYDMIEDLTLEGFSKRLEQLEIRIESKMVERLFKALTLEESYEYDIETFEIFIEIYQSKEEELQRINKYLPKRALRSIEFALKISSRQNVPGIGIGLVVLTQHCLYFLEQGTHKMRLLLELKGIIAIEKTQYKSNLFNSKSSLKITYVNSSEVSQLQTIFLCVENEVNVWYTLIQELCYAIKFSKQLLDKSLIQYAAKNVLLTDALLASGLNLTTTHSRNLTKAASYLCYFSNTQDPELRRFSTESSQALRYRINPSSREVENMSIESIIYVDIQEYPTVWCAIGNRVRIYDGITWDEQSSDLKTNDKITCLCHDPAECKVWIGTVDKCLYVIDVVSREFNKKIERHTDSIVSLAISKKLNCIMSASLNGEIILWDSKSLECLKTNGNNDSPQRLVCCAFSQTYILKCLLHNIEVISEDFGKVEQVLDFQITTKDEDRDQIISCICVTTSDEDELLWAGSSTNGIICIWSLKSFELKIRVAIDSKGLTTLLSIDEKVWAGTKDGVIGVFCTQTFECEKSFDAHKDAIKALCGFKLQGNVVSGSDKKDGTIAVWNSSLGSGRSIAGTLRKLLINDPQDN